jgi:hypothetical protein
MIFAAAARFVSGLQRFTSVVINSFTFIDVLLSFGEELLRVTPVTTHGETRDTSREAQLLSPWRIGGNVQVDAVATTRNRYAGCSPHEVRELLRKRGPRSTPHKGAEFRRR